jgi:phospholipase C
VRPIALVALAAALAGCSAATPAVLSPSTQYAIEGRKTTPIKHVVLVIQENRTFNDFFATFKGADGTTIGKAEADAACGIAGGKTIALKKMGLVTKLNGKPQDLDHGYRA